MAAEIRDEGVDLSLARRQPARLSAPSEHLLGRQPIPARNLRNNRPRQKRLFNNPGLEIIEVSAISGSGFEHWLAWLEAGLEKAGKARNEAVATLRARVADLEAQLAARP